MEYISILKRLFTLLIALPIMVFPSMSIGVTAKELSLYTDEIPEMVIQDIENENPYAISIIILERGYAKSKLFTIPSIGNKFILPYDNIEKTVTNSRLPLEDKFITSSAKGMTFKSNTKFKSWIRATATGKLTPARLGLITEYKFSMQTGYVFVGPPEDSAANTREYRVKFYGDAGTYTATEYSELPGGAGMMTRDINGTWSQPLEYYIYAVDRAV